jgi:hypothetical protein
MGITDHVGESMQERPLSWWVLLLMSAIHLLVICGLAVLNDQKRV